MTEVSREIILESMSEQQTETREHRHSPIDDLRQIDDARTLKALAHPVRVALIETLSVEGPMTATEAGERIGESPTTCSFHLRQLAKYGFVEEAGERPHQSALALPLLAEKEHVVAGDEGEVHFGDDRVFVADHPWEEFVAPAEGLHEVVADFLFDGFGFPAALAELAKRGGPMREGSHGSLVRSSADEARQSGRTPSAHCPIVVV